MMDLKPLLVALTLTSSVTVLAQNKAVYGKDNRQDVYATTNPSFLELAKSTAAMIPNNKIKRGFLQRNYKIKAESLADLGMCLTERFAKQPTAADCSGFLVAPNKLVTAGHCIKSISDCNSVKWVFDYKLDSASQSEIKIAPENVYKCTKIISRELNSTTRNDYALVELDRPVTDREPLKLRSAGKAGVGDELVVIGHPTGLPTKIADGAKVRSAGEVFFVANLDTYGGNSGSAVFNVKTNEVEGILVRGEKDYVSAGGCMVSKVCEDDECRGEDVTYITNVPGL